MADNEKKPNEPFKLFMWWKLDEKEISKQIENYNSLPVLDSVRKISALLILAMVALTLICVTMGWTKSDAIVDAIVLSFLAIFVYRGHRWAIISTMAIWTLEKGYLTVYSKSNLVIQLIWWAFLMNPLYTAFRVEKARAKKSPPSRPKKDIAA